MLKVGSNPLAADGGGLTVRNASALGQFITASYAQGKQVVLVSSGAVAAGRALLREHALSGGDLMARQALAARSGADGCVVAGPVGTPDGAGAADSR